MNPDQVICVVCGKKEGKFNLVGERGLNTLIQSSIDKEEHALYEELSRCQEQQIPVHVHNECRKRANDMRGYGKSVPKVKKLRSSTDTVFNWKTCCFLCVKAIDTRNKKREEIREVRTLPIHGSLMQCAKDRNDEWGQAVLARLETCSDLVAAEAKYHLMCLTRFKQKGKESRNSIKGRPTDARMTEAFENVCEWLESSGDSEVHTIHELFNKMMEDSNDNVYSMKSFREKLKARYKEHVYFVQAAGCKGELVCFKAMSDYILRELKEKGSDKKENVIKAAAKIIKEEIREMNSNKDHYPSVGTIEENENWVPDSLRMLMRCIIPSKIKQVSISQCIIQATRPKTVIAPIPFGVGLTIDKSTGCKQMITHFSRLGFSISPEEVGRFKQSVIEDMENDSDENNSVAGQGFQQWVADNVDHNIATLTGKGTFHGMGVIRVDSLSRGEIGKIRRLPSRQPAKEFTKHRGIEMLPYQQASRAGLAKFAFEPLSQTASALISSSASFSAMEAYDLLWHSAWYLSSEERPRPNWSGFLQCSTRAVTHPKSASVITFLPIIDLSSSDHTCIYSTLCFIIEQAKKLNTLTPCVTFDQPLWLKALDIIHAENLPIVCRLGGFHTLMSFLGSIGVIMKGSGLEDLLAEVYAENSVTHMMSGKAIARAIRGHLLVESSLMSLLLEIIQEKRGIEFEEMERFYTSALDGDLGQEVLCQLQESSVFTKLSDALASTKAELRDQSRTSELWLLYMHYISIMKAFIFAERTSNWELHLDVLSEMLNLFAATGHTNYAKCARLYVQQMRKLPITHPWLYEQFVGGYHTVHRTNKNWTGIWTDLAIEQTMMRSIKSRGGLTGGRGMTESARHTWVLSLSHVAMIHETMVQLTGAATVSSEQHQELGRTRTKQDYHDCLKFLDWLKLRNPFQILDENLHALSTGLVSTVGDGVNCEKSEEVGKAIQAMLNTVPFNDAAIKRKDQVKSLESLQRSGSTHLQGEVSSVDPHLIFNRLVTIASREENIQEFFQYELTQEPMSLFKGGMMRKPAKPALRKVIMPDVNSIKKQEMTNCQSYVIDGGALLHRVRWSKGTVFRLVAEAYAAYINRHYNSEATIVFDGYCNQTTKDHEHLRRNSIPQSNRVNINEDNEVPFTQDRFLSNSENKAGLIEFLSTYLRRVGFSVTNCPGDADTEIVKTALKCVKENTGSVVVAADDTDIVVMLVHHWEEGMRDIFFLQERWGKAWSVMDASRRNSAIKEFLLFIHAWSGCDTTSAVFGKGKQKVVQMLAKSEELKNLACTVISPWSDQADVGEASIQSFVLLYGGKKGDTLTKLRYNRYIDMACTGIISPEKLPPTEQAAYFHGLRSHYQIMLWSLIEEDSMYESPAEEWGWEMQNGSLRPIMTDQEIAPDSLTKIIKCNCKITTKSPCSTKTCTCRKYGIPCMSTCGECRGLECSNRQVRCSDTEEIEQDRSVESANYDEIPDNIFDIISDFY